MNWSWKREERNMPKVVIVVKDEDFQLLEHLRQAGTEIVVLPTQRELREDRALIPPAIKAITDYVLEPPIKCYVPDQPRNKFPHAGMRHKKGR